ncbi:MAG: SCO family protein [Candidatus Accumulibacter sp.]|nr:SCO family protein [Candidatus Accumulibacter propinquus]
MSASDGRERRLADFRGQVVALSVGYTQCPDVCPTTLLVLKGAVEALPLVQRQRVQVLFATLDPDRDGLAMLKEYVAAFSPAGGRPVLGCAATPRRRQD